MFLKSNNTGDKLEILYCIVNDKIQINRQYLFQ